MSDAVYLVHWPGKDTPACIEHTQKLIGLGAILGFRVSYTPTNGNDKCSNCESELKLQSRGTPESESKS